jgi:hypothetical protein
VTGKDKYNKDITIEVPNPYHEMEKLAHQLPKQAEVIETSGRYIIVQAVEGIADTTLMFKRSLKEIKDRYIFTDVDRELVTKICTKISMQPEINVTFLRSLISFIAKENPTLPVDAIMSIITKCMYKCVKTESDLQIIKDAKITEFINAAKAGQLKSVPTTLIESIFTGNLYNYLKIQIRNSILGDKSEANKYKVSSWDPFQ